ncbi:unnamed protein product [Linum tenue]|uniref:Uncharacterized protein n=1 Tax=Linum tenue TaxID=586396 RepID=A0AAV0LJP3_9ROSI|nr:unnamed protein product [Linum tenue]
MDVNPVGGTVGAGLPGFLLVLPPDVLLVIGEGHVEIEGLVPLGEAQPDEGVLPRAVLDLEHEVARRVQHRLHRRLPLPRRDEAGGEQIPRVRILQPDLAPVLARNDPEPARPDLVRLQPLAALVTPGGGARRDFGVLERVFVLLERHFLSVKLFLSSLYRAHANTEMEQGEKAGFEGFVSLCSILAEREMANR